MELTVKDMNIETGGPAVAILNRADAVVLDLHHEDRVKLKCGRKETTAIVDIAESRKAVAPGRIGLFEETLVLLNARGGSRVNLSLEEKPVAVQFIRKKLDGAELTDGEIKEIIKEIADNHISSVELSYFVAACYTRGLSLKETLAMTKAMVSAGKKIKLAGKVMDLHCIGGVPGNRTTMIVVPIVAAAGLRIPKTSSRAITSPAGTADTMEVLAKVDISIGKMLQVIKRTNGCIVWGGAINLAPADDKIIHIEHPLSIDAEGQMLASVMAKKHSVSSNHLLLDIPLGRATKIKSMHHAKHLKKLFIIIGKKLGIKVRVMITDGSQPIGNGIGPVLEAIDCLKVLKNSNGCPQDLKEKSILMAGALLEMGGKAKKGCGKELARALLESGAACRKMMQIIKAQGRSRTRLEPGDYAYEFRSSKSGTVVELDNLNISKVARIAGAPMDQGAGIYLHKHIGDKVARGEAIFTVYAECKEKRDYAIGILKEKNCVVVA